METSLTPQSLSAEHMALIRVLEKAGTKAALARICGCTEPNIGQLVKKKRGLSARFVPKVAAALGLPYHEIRPDIFPVPIASEAA